MCLIDTKRFKFTFKPIKVYKVLRFDNIIPGTTIKLSRKNIALKEFIYSCNTMEKAEALIESITYHEIRKVYSLNKILWQDKQIIKFFQNKYKIVEGYIIGRYAIGNNNDICSRILILNL